ncbi:MAG: DUF2461 domain-containing protein [Bacteroidia bacterium]
MKNVLPFLKKLKSNNNNEWFDKNRTEYLSAKQSVEILVGKVIQQINAFDKAIDKSTDPKKCLFRINKDVRFSKDKSPYKTNFGASIAPGGKKTANPGYYIHIAPGEIFIAGGSYMPEPVQLNAFRQEIDYNGKELVKILKSKSFSTYFDGIDKIDVLKTTPKGFAKDHPHIDLLRNKHFIVSHSFTEKDLLSSDFDKKIVKCFKAMHPFIEFLRKSSSN